MVGTRLLARRKGNRTHRMLGPVWAALMMVTALSSFGVHSITGEFSPIHILSVITIVGLVVSVRAAMRGEVRIHQRAISRLFISLVLAGLATFIPGGLRICALARHCTRRWARTGLGGARNANASRSGGQKALEHRPKMPVVRHDGNVASRKPRSVSKAIIHSKR